MGCRPSILTCLIKLGATDEQLDFPIIYASAINGFATNDIDKKN